MRINTAPVRVMPIGDSLTEGGLPDYPDASYRGYLEAMLREAGYAVEYVGTQRGPAHGTASLAHEGHGGFTIGPDRSLLPDQPGFANLYDHLHEYLELQPQIMLLLIGINDLFPSKQRPVVPAEAAGKLQRLVARISRELPDTQLFVASLAPTRLDDINWADYQAINRAASATALEHRNVHFVDINRELSAIVDPSADYVDDIHFNEQGAQKMARIWLGALQEHFRQC